MQTSIDTIAAKFKLSPENCIISIKGNPKHASKAIDWFASKWGIDRKKYEQSFDDCRNKNGSLPRLYLMLNKADEIVGGYGLILNDFIDRTDLYPYLCALFV